MITAPRIASTLTSPQLISLVALRWLIGWHLLYEGVAKLLNPYWTSAGYLSESQGPLAFLFIRLAANPSVLGAVDTINIWSLMILGLILLLGLFERPAAVGGAALLTLYYVCMPPLLSVTSPIPIEGSYLLVNKTLIEAAALTVLALFPTSHRIGLDRLLLKDRLR